jgi:hypothetical protein
METIATLLIAYVCVQVIVVIGIVMVIYGVCSGLQPKLERLFEWIESVLRKSSGP